MNPAIPLALALLLSVPPAAAGAQDRVRDDDPRLRMLKSQARNPSVPLESRQDAVLDYSRELDKEASASPTETERIALWDESARELEAFNRENPRHSLEPMFRLQASVYRWAIARSFARALDTDPINKNLREKALAGLEGAIDELASLVLAVGDKKDLALVEQNARYRLAQSLADLADLKERSPDRDARAKARVDRERGVRVLAAPFRERALEGPVELLRARLLIPLDRTDAAAKALDLAAADPGVSAAEVDSSRVALLIRKGDFEAAEKAIEKSRLDDTARRLLRIKVGIARQKAKPAEHRWDESERALYDDLEKLKSQAREADLMPALTEIGVEISSPGRDAPAGAWDLLAEAKRALGDDKTAANFEVEAARRAELERASAKACEYRFRAGALYYRAGDFPRAVEELLKVRDDDAGGGFRAKAGLLRALALGELRASNPSAAADRAYQSSLEDQLTRFPDDPSRGRALLLLGEWFMSRGKTDLALARLAEIDHKSEFWLQARLAIAASRQGEIDLVVRSGDAAARRRLDELSSRELGDALAAAGEDPKAGGALRLAKARLDVTPGIDRAEDARTAALRLVMHASSENQRAEARRILIVAEAALSRFDEAEEHAKELAQGATLGEAMEVAALLDQQANMSEEDTRRRRIAPIMLTILEGKASPDAGVELEPALRRARASAFAGDYRGAKDTLARPARDLTGLRPMLLLDAGDLFIRLGDFRRALAIHHALAGKSTAGSTLWFLARYGEALSAYRSGADSLAVKLIDAAAILHPDLGGAALQEKFARLRQKAAHH